MKQLIGFCIHRPVATIMVFIALIVFGVLAAFNLSIDFLPSVKIPKLVVAAGYSGLPPSEIRQLVTIPLENTLSSLNGIKNISSVSRQGVSIIELTFHWGTDMDKAGVETREFIDIAYSTLPAGAGKPVVLPIHPGEGPVMTISVLSSSGDTALARKLCEREIKTRLQQVEGVGSIAIIGGADEEIHVRVHDEKASAYGITFEFLHSVLQASNITFPAGTITEGILEYVVKTEGRLENIDALSNLLVPSPHQGDPIPLKEIADVGFAPAEQNSFFQNMGSEGIGIAIRRQGTFSPVKLSENVSKELSRIEQSYSKDLIFSVVQDESVLISKSITTLIVSASLGACIAFLVILFFLKSLSVSFILVISFPVSILFCLVLLYLTKRSINIMSLGGMVIGIGMLVDNGIVILENLGRRVPVPSSDKTECVAEAASEMAGSTFGSTFTTLIVFLPVIFLPGVIGSLFTDLALSVSYSLVGSYLCSITLTPVLYILITSKPKNRNKSSLPAGSVNNSGIRLSRTIEKSYRKILLFIFRKPVFILPTLVLVCTSGIVSYFTLKVELMPEINTGELLITAEADPGLSMDEIKLRAGRLADELMRSGLIESVFIRAGGEPDDVYYQADAADRKGIIHARAVISKQIGIPVKTITEYFREHLLFFDLQIQVAPPDNILLPLLGIQRKTMVVAVSGNSQKLALANAGTLAAEIEAAFGPGQNMILLPAEKQMELILTPLRDALSRTGNAVTSVSNEVRASLTGSIPTQLIIDGEEINVRIRSSTGKNRSRLELNALTLLTPDYKSTQLRELMGIKEEMKFNILLRKKHKDVVYINISNPDNRIRELIKSYIAGNSRNRSFTLQEEGVIRENMVLLVVTFSIAAFLMYLLLGAQFESFIEPLILFLSFPFAISGVFLALVITGNSLNINSSLSILVLLGIVINNSIILFGTYKSKFLPNTSAIYAVYRGSSVRIIPILLTMLTTVLALIPISINVDNTNPQSGMSIAIIGGLFLSTCLTVFIQPLIFYAYFRRKNEHKKTMA